MIRTVDTVRVHVPDFEQGLRFYRDHLGHRLLWRTKASCGLALTGSETELVLSTTLGPETHLEVLSSPEAAERFVAGGGRIIAAAHESQTGSVAVVADPFGNHLILLDHSRGRLAVDGEGNVTGVRL